MLQYECLILLTWRVWDWVDFGGIDTGSIRYFWQKLMTDSGKSGKKSIEFFLRFKIRGVLNLIHPEFLEGGVSDYQFRQPSEMKKKYLAPT